MRGLVMSCLCAISLVPDIVRAQRLVDLTPGTLIRLTLRTGATVVGPLDGVRADTVFIATNVQHPAAAVPVASIAATSFADGKAPGRVFSGTLIGAGVGGMLAYLVGGAETGDFDPFTTWQFRVGVTALGTLIGRKIGVAKATPNWVPITVAHGRPAPLIEPTRFGLAPPF